MPGHHPIKPEKEKVMLLADTTQYCLSFTMEGYGARCRLKHNG